MIRSVQDPPMGPEDIARFRRNLAKHLRDDYTPEERREREERKAFGKAVLNQIIANCGGKNPLLGY